MADNLTIFSSPELKDVVQDMRELLSQSRLAFLIGAGCSKNAGLPLMLELTNEVMEYRKISEKTKKLLDEVRKLFSGADDATIEDFMSEIVDLLSIAERRTQRGATKSWLNKATYDRISFDFLGFTFQPRLVKTRKGQYRVCFLPAISQKAAKRIRSSINEWPWQKWQQCDIAVIMRYSRNKLRGWMNYYGVQGKMAIANLLFHFDKKLSRWALHKYKKVRSLIQAAKRVNAFRRRNRQLLAHWNRACLQG